MKNLYSILLLLLFVACTKGPGEGGTSMINGRVIHYTTEYNTQTSTNDTLYFPKAGKDVYIIYGNDIHDIYDDNVETDWNGNFQFDFLRKGEYVIYTYIDSNLTGSVDYDFPVFRNITINDNNSINTINEFILEN